MLLVLHACTFTLVQDTSKSFTSTFLANPLGGTNLPKSFFTVHFIGLSCLFLDTCLLSVMKLSTTNISLPAVIYIDGNKTPKS